MKKNPNIYISLTLLIISTLNALANEEDNTNEKIINPNKAPISLTQKEDSHIQQELELELDFS